MLYVEAPNKIESNKKSLFLAGGITGTPNWQKDLLSKISLLDIVVYNPRRAEFDITNPNNTEEQIIWEHDMLRKADAISFWFCKEAIQPIVLYELGTHSMTSKPVLVGLDPGYERKNDVEIQTRLVRPEIKIVYTLNDLSNQIYALFNELKFIS